jgi:hypothetical protein
MATAAEIAARYGYSPEEEEERDIPAVQIPTAESIAARYGYEEQKLAPKSVPTALPKTVKRPLLGRAKDKIQQGASDAISSFMGETYGRGTAEPADKTPINMAYRPISAAANAIEGLAGGVGEVIGAADEAIGSPLSRTMAWMSENQSQNPQYANLGLEQGKTDLKEAYPEQYPAIAEAASVLTAAAPYSKALKISAGTKAMENLPKKQAAYRRSDIEKRWAPEKPFGEKGSVTENGILKTDTYNADPARIQRYDDLETIEKLNPRESAGNNFGIIESEVGKLRNQLDNDLRLENYMDVQDVNSAVSSAWTKAEALPVLRGDVAGKAANAVYDQFQDTLKKYEVDGQIKPGELLKARRELDSWLKINDPNIFEGQSLSGTTVAIKTIRDALNKEVARAVPRAEVAESLRKQSSLLTSRDELIPQANRQGKNRISRAVQRTQEEFGLAMPHSAAAVGANLQALPLAIGGTLAAATLGGRAARTIGNYTGAGLKRTLQEIYNPSRGALPYAAIADDEEENR